jgi:hypothetical protein
MQLLIELFTLPQGLRWRLVGHLRPEFDPMAIRVDHRMIEASAHGRRCGTAITCHD